MTQYQDLNSKISEILQKFYNTNDYTIALDYILKEMAELCKIDRLCVIMQNHSNNSNKLKAYSTVLEYELVDNINIISNNYFD